ncbi:unnamed protein product [Paramecium sonneborni]|uniref:Uncharacterized protein n=1 Tax=Paramecium sonneborni TaxID=65129 RepID=A0A8S1NVU8_9CILI|nr:unnamed protein product [Paramecium sonneborni]
MGSNFIKPKSTLTTTCYQLHTPKIKTTANCLNAIALNKEKNLLVTTCSKDITFYSIKKEQLKKMQQIVTHDHNITLNIFQNRKQFVIGSENKSIKIWSLNLLSNAKYIIKLKGNSTIYLVIHPYEDKFMYGSKEKAIKIWSQNPSWLSQQLDLGFIDKLKWQQINIFWLGQFNFDYGREKNKEWEVKQRISVDKWEHRLTFINDKVFSFQPVNIINRSWIGSTNLHLFIFESISGQYTLNKKITVSCSCQRCTSQSPQQYIPSKQILLIKNGHFLNLVQLKFVTSTKFECILAQAIEFSCESLLGTLSEDGYLLVSWNKSIYDIQIRILKP